MKKVKPNLEKPFSIEAYEAGAEFCNADGYKRRVLAVDVPGGSPIIACDEHGHIFRFGMRSDSTGLDLFEILPEPTHREDGTPLDIPPLPEVDGWRFEYRGKGWGDDGNECTYLYTSDKGVFWQYALGLGSTPGGKEKLHYAEAFRVAKPTTIEDLFADGAQCWIHYNSNSVYLVTSVFPSGEIGTRIDAGFKPSHFSRKHCRYSNSPLTKWEDAKPFIGKGGE